MHSKCELREKQQSKTWYVNYEIKKPLYLVSVAKFTNLSGNQVSLVLFNVNGVNIILQREKNMLKEINKPEKVHFLGKC